VSACKMSGSLPSTAVPLDWTQAASSNPLSNSSAKIGVPPAPERCARSTGRSDHGLPRLPAHRGEPRLRVRSREGDGVGGSRRLRHRHQNVANSHTWTWSGRGAAGVQRGRLYPSRPARPRRRRAQPIEVALAGLRRAFPANVGGRSRERQRRPGGSTNEKRMGSGTSCSAQRSRKRVVYRSRE
jgi:hypothetical protein